MGTLIGSISIDAQDLQELFQLIFADTVQKIDGTQLQANIRLKVGEIVKEAIHSSPPYISLTTGKLKGHFGLGPAQIGDVETIIDVIVDKMLVQVDITNTSGRVTVGVLQSDFQDILTTPSNPTVGTYISVSKDGKHKSPVPWLKWLLTSGSIRVVTEFELLKSTGFTSRAGYFMYRPKSRAARGFSVTEYAGTQADNWLTRALVPLQAEIGRVVANEVQNFLGGP